MRGRPNWDEYFLRMLPLIASRTTCLSRKVGAIITMNNRIVATGYNGPPPGQPHCGDLFGQCYRRMKGFKSGERLDLCRAVHAEENAILQCAKDGLSIKGATLYLPVMCCYHCSKLVVSVGIKRLVYIEDFFPDYETNEGNLPEFLANSDVEIVKKVLT